MNTRAHSSAIGRTVVDPATCSFIACSCVPASLLSIQPDPSSDTVIAAIRSVASIVRGKNLRDVCGFSIWCITAAMCATAVYIVSPKKYVYIIYLT